MKVRPASVLGEVPVGQRERLLLGLRWTVWLSALAAPFSAGTNILLARVGPETIGVYGVLTVWVGLMASVFYFGGDPVVIRFMPDCRPRDRGTFLLTYSLLIFASLLGWLLIADIFPGVLGMILGDDEKARFRLLAIGVAPIPIAFWMIAASLKGMLDIRFSQILTRSLPIVAFIAYAGLYIIRRPLLSHSPFTVIWTVYLLPMIVLGMVGAIRVIQQCGLPRLRFYLPPGFWSYALGAQQSGIVFFFAYRLDYLLLLHFGGLGMLGRYVALMTVAGLVPMVNGFFMDTLLPSLTNTLAARNSAGAAQVFIMHMRILFLVATAMSCGVMVLAPAATSLMGDKYRSIQSLIILMGMVQGIAHPAAFGGTVLLSVGRQRLTTWSALLHMVLFGGLFFALWPVYGLTGAVIAYAVALTVSFGSMMLIAARVAPAFPSINGLWLTAALVDVLICVISLHWKPLGPIAGMSIWAGAMTLFMIVGRYRIEECRMLAELLMPGAGWGRTHDIVAVGRSAQSA